MNESGWSVYLYTNVYADAMRYPLIFGIFNGWPEAANDD